MGTGGIAVKKNSVLGGVCILISMIDYGSDNESEKAENVTTSYLWIQFYKITVKHANEKL